MLPAVRAGPWSGAMMMMMFGQNNVLYINRMGAEARQEVGDNDAVKCLVHKIWASSAAQTGTSTSLIYQED